MNLNTLLPKLKVSLIKGNVLKVGSKFGFIFLVFFSFSIGYNNSINWPFSEAVPSIVEAATPVNTTCIGDGIAEYAADVISSAGNVPNIEFATPAFNMDSPYFEGISRTFFEYLPIYGANVSDFDHIAGNAYNKYDGGGFSASAYDILSSRRAFLSAVSPNTTSIPFLVTETGWYPPNAAVYNNNPVAQDLNITLQTMRNDSTLNISGAILFNIFNTGNESQFGYHAYPANAGDPALVKQNICPGLNCDRIGANSASFYYTAELYSQAASTGDAGAGQMTHTLEISNEDLDSTQQGVRAALTNGLTPVIRIGTQDGASTAFLPPSGAQYYGGVFIKGIDSYVAGLKADGVVSSDSKVIVIAGPNEPESECWATPQCGGDCEPAELPDRTIIKGRVFSNVRMTDPLTGLERAGGPVHGASIGIYQGSDQTALGNLKGTVTKIGAVTTDYTGFYKVILNKGTSPAPVPEASVTTIASDSTNLSFKQVQADNSVFADIVSDEDFGDSWAFSSGNTPNNMFYDFAHDNSLFFIAFCGTSYSEAQKVAIDLEYGPEKHFFLNCPQTYYPQPPEPPESVYLPGLASEGIAQCSIHHLMDNILGLAFEMGVGNPSIPVPLSCDDCNDRYIGLDINPPEDANDPAWGSVGSGVPAGDGQVSRTAFGGRFASNDHVAGDTRSYLVSNILGSVQYQGKKPYMEGRPEAESLPPVEVLCHANSSYQCDYFNPDTGVCSDTGVPNKYKANEAITSGFGLAYAEQNYFIKMWNDIYVPSTVPGDPESFKAVARKSEDSNELVFLCQFEPHPDLIQELEWPVPGCPNAEVYPYGCFPYTELGALEKTTKINGAEETINDMFVPRGTYGAGHPNAGAPTNPWDKVRNERLGEGDLNNNAPAAAFLTFVQRGPDYSESKYEALVNEDTPSGYPLAKMMFDTYGGPMGCQGSSLNDVECNSEIASAVVDQSNSEQYARYFADPTRSAYSAIPMDGVYAQTAQQSFDLLNAGALLTNFIQVGRGDHQLMVPQVLCSKSLLVSGGDPGNSALSDNLKNQFDGNITEPYVNSYRYAGSEAFGSEWLARNLEFWPGAAQVFGYLFAINLGDEYEQIDDTLFDVDFSATVTDEGWITSGSNWPSAPNEAACAPGEYVWSDLPGFHPCDFDNPDCRLDPINGCEWQPESGDPEYDPSNPGAWLACPISACSWEDICDPGGGSCATPPGIFRCNYEQGVLDWDQYGADLGSPECAADVKTGAIHSASMVDNHCELQGGSVAKQLASMMQDSFHVNRTTSTLHVTNFSATHEEQKYDHTQAANSNCTNVSGGEAYYFRLLAAQLADPYYYPVDREPQNPPFVGQIQDIGEPGTGSDDGLCQVNTGPACNISRLETEFPPEEAENASIVCNRESGGSPTHENFDCLFGITYDFSVGLFQINLAHPKRDSEGNVYGYADRYPVGHPLHEPGTVEYVDTYRCDNGAFVVWDKSRSGDFCKIPDIDGDGIEGGREFPTVTDPVLYDQDDVDLLAACVDYFKDEGNAGQNNIDWAVTRACGNPPESPCNWSAWAGAAACGIYQDI